MGAVRRMRTNLCKDNEAALSPLIFTNTSSKCHCQFEYARIWLTLFLCSSGNETDCARHMCAMQRDAP